MEMLAFLISSVLTCEFVTTADVKFSICDTETVVCWPLQVIFEKSMPCFRGNANFSLQNGSVDAA
jgi:hypothetical protein